MTRLDPRTIANGRNMPGYGNTRLTRDEPVRWPWVAGFVMAVAVFVGMVI